MGKKDVNGQMNEAEVAADEPAAEPAQTASEAAASEAASSEAAPSETAVSEEAAVAEAEATDEASPPAPVQPVDPLEQLADELRKTKDQLLRQAAEYQNFRRRTERERAEWSQRARIPVLEPMLTVLDDFRRSLDASEQVEQQETPGPAYKALKEGVDLVYKNFNEALSRLGVEYIEAVGQPFDENLHEAMMQMPAPDGTAPGIVLQEIQRGYRLGDRVLRHSKVIVAA